MKERKRKIFLNQKVDKGKAELGFISRFLWPLIMTLMKVRTNAIHVIKHASTQKCSHDSQS